MKRYAAGISNGWFDDERDELDDIESAIDSAVKSLGKDVLQAVVDDCEGDILDAFELLDMITVQSRRQVVEDYLDVGNVSRDIWPYINFDGLWDIAKNEIAYIEMPDGRLIVY